MKELNVCFQRMNFKGKIDDQSHLENFMLSFSKQVLNLGLKESVFTILNLGGKSS